MVDDIFAGETKPFDLFERWFAAAQQAEPLADAVTLATVDQSGMPNARLVLVKQSGPNGFCFYTHATSAKGCELANNGKAAMAFHWKSLGRQVRLRGVVSPLEDAASDEYFASRPRGSQIGAWASRQSAVLEQRASLQADVDALVQKFGDAPVPRPDQWIGYRLLPLQIEFWQDQPSRLHDRLQFTRPDIEDETWTITRLYP